MSHTRISILATGLCLAACGPTIPVASPHHGDLSDELIQLDHPGPPPGPNGVCWADDVTPAVIETVTEQELDTPERRDAAGTVISPASYRSVSKLRMLHDRAEVWFKTPCAGQMTAETIATLQRALKARGYYALPLTGVFDDATKEAVRKYQAAHGFDSPVLTLAAARDLGVLATDLSKLP